MAKTKNIYFALLVFSLLALPLISLASVAPTGAPCAPDILSAFAPPNQAAPATCTTSPQVAGDILHLKWDLQGTYQYPDCHITCNNDLPGLTMYPCRSFNPNVSGSFVNDIRLANYTYNISNRDSNNFLSATGTQQDLKAKDDVYVRNAQAGDDYLVTCREKDKVDAEAKVKTSVLARVVEGTQGGACELPWSNTEEGLKQNKPFHVTEANLSDWVTKIQEKDFSKYGYGSGDTRDISDFMIGGQCDYTACILGKGACPKPIYFSSKIIPISPMGQAWADALTAAKKTVNIAGLPKGLGIRSLNWAMSISNNKLVYTGHAVILVGINDLGNNVYNFDIIDPNIPDRVSSLTNCKYAEMDVTSSGLTGKDLGLSCDPLDTNVYPAKDGPAFIYQISDLYDKAFLAFYNFCQNPNNATQYKDLCSRDKGKSSINQWLKDNLTSFSNINYGGGTCHAWSEFFVNVAFLGDFVGTDYHPDDGKIVGKDCDINHYPFKKTSVANSNNWLANVWAAFGHLFPVNL